MNYEIKFENNWFFRRKKNIKVKHAGWTFLSSLYIFASKLFSMTGTPYLYFVSIHIGIWIDLLEN